MPGCFGRAMGKMVFSHDRLLVRSTMIAWKQVTMEQISAWLEERFNGLEEVMLFLGSIEAGERSRQHHEETARLHKTLSQQLESGRASSRALVAKTGMNVRKVARSVIEHTLFVGLIFFLIIFNSAIL